MLKTVGSHIVKSSDNQWDSYTH